MADKNPDIDLEQITVHQILKSLKPKHVISIIAILFLFSGLGYKFKSLLVESQIERIKLEAAHEQTIDLPLYRYLSLKESGKILLLTAKNSLKVDLKLFTIDQKFPSTEVNEQSQILANDLKWLEINDGSVKITDKGINDLSTFEDLLFGRYAP